VEAAAEAGDEGDLMDSKPRFAGAAPRILAIVIDLVILSAVFFPVTRLLKGEWLMSSAQHRWSAGLFVTDPLCLVFVAVMFLYFVILEWWAGGTPGKLLLGLRVVGINGGRAGFAAALIRNLLRVIDGLPVLGIAGILLITSSDQRARLGDRVAGSRVIRGAPICRPGFRRRIEKRT
jgi:uncharacterized RDD family membrane protein YckC